MNSMVMFIVFAVFVFLGLAIWYMVHKKDKETESEAEGAEGETEGAEGETEGDTKAEAEEDIDATLARLADHEDAAIREELDAMDPNTSEYVRRVAGYNPMVHLKNGMMQASSLDALEDYKPVGFYTLDLARPAKFTKMGSVTGGYAQCHKMCAEDVQCTGFFVNTDEAEGEASEGSCNFTGYNPELRHAWGTKFPLHLKAGEPFRFPHSNAAD